MTEREDTPEARRQSRRQFLSRAGIAAAGVAAGGIAGGLIGDAIGQSQAHGTEEEQAQIGYHKFQPRDSPGFDHLVVVMFENRSFDNLLGYLYDDTNLPAGKTFNGLNFGHYSNVDEAGNEIPAHPYTGETDFVMRQPSPDPGEQYDHVNVQLFGRYDPVQNEDLTGEQMEAPWNAPPKGAKATMSGFVRDYIDDLRLRSGLEPGIDDYSVVMGSFTPTMLPVFSTLARSFAVYDNWHCAVPTQTFPNRSFFHASTSHGYVTNEGGDEGIRKWFNQKNDVPTIFNRLSEANIPWAVYFDDRQLVSMTGFIHAPSIQKYWRTNFRTMTQFYDDVEKGNLPAYSFVEPRLVYDHNDMHPPAGVKVQPEAVDGDVITGGAISDVRAGDTFLHEIYTSVRSSANEDGSNALNTMLLVTFDEHGGIYDHVPPPAATPPDDRTDNEMDFSFDRLGVRVPAIAISAYTARNTIIHEQMHHSSVIATLVKRFQLKHLTKRDETATTIDNAVNLSAPRQPQDWPDTHPHYVPPNPEALNPNVGKAGDRPLSPPGAGLMALLVSKYGAPGEKPPTTYREAFDLTARRGLGLFGSKTIHDLDE